MADLSIYELEDIIWDEFAQSDDHIVPRSSDENANEHASQGDSPKKPRREVIDVSSNADGKYATKCVIHKKEERDFSTVNKPNNTMLEKDPWSHTPDNMFSASCDSDSIKEVKSLASDNTSMSSCCFKSNCIDSLGELCSDDPILSGKCTTVDNNSYNYTLTHISQTDNDREDKEYSDLLYYGWPDIGNFEDVDRMFRSCDSSLWLGSAGNEDEIGWFSSSYAIEGSEDALQSNFKFSCPDSNALKNISEGLEPSNLKTESSSVNDSSMKSASGSYTKASSRLSENDEPASLSCFSFVNGSSQISESKDDSNLKDQGVQFNGGFQYRISTNNQFENDNRMINFHEKQQKHQNQKEGKRIDKFVENGALLRHNGDLQKQDIHLPSGDTPHKGFTYIGVQRQKQNLGPGSIGYLHTNIPYMPSDYHQPSDQTTVTLTLSGIKSENNALTSFSPKESSYASNQVQPMESSHDIPIESTDNAPDDMRGKLHRQQGFQPSFASNSKHVDLVVQASICDPISVRTGNEFENHSDSEGVSIGVPAELGPLNGQESSSIYSGLNDVSLEATSFCQLQQVMEQLDLRTRLCIRDSLYRLARSAEQRHNYANLNGVRGGDRNTSGALMAEGSNKCTGFIDIETDTNPIDRSIAHLLFHRPSDSSVMPAPIALFLKSHTMIPGSVTSPPMMVEKFLCHEESAPETDRMVADH